MRQQAVIRRRSVDVGALSWEGHESERGEQSSSLTMDEGGDGERFFIKMKTRYYCSFDSYIPLIMLLLFNLEFQVCVRSWAHRRARGPKKSFLRNEGKISIMCLKHVYPR